MKKLMWLAVDSNGYEKISSNPEGFQRFSPFKYHYGSFEERRIEHQKVVAYEDTMEDHDIWIEFHTPDETPRFGIVPTWIFVPNGTVKKILGRELTWHDEPVKIEEP